MLIIIETFSPFTDCNVIFFYGYSYGQNYCQPPDLFDSFQPLVYSLLGKIFYVLSSFMPHILQTPALVNQLINLNSDEKWGNICVLHMTI